MYHSLENRQYPAQRGKLIWFENQLEKYRTLLVRDRDHNWLKGQWLSYDLRKGVKSDWRNNPIDKNEEKHT